ncbi:MAG: MogA/MoaB family molybdenum cofactor biosynthesis protein [Solirubrobacterales bacterium]|nr:MogA/MoaB family molybdenum cofactor biosynthesis protein [Solirubrobacterales bacterium]
MNAAVLTISTSVSTGRSEDRSGPALARLIREAGVEVRVHEVVPDDRGAIEATLRRFCAAEAGIDLLFTTGGTGLTPDDVTPEATGAVIEREAPGFAEAMRARSLEHTPLGILTRGISGVAGRTLIINFPGNPKAIDELFPVVAPTLEHAVATLRRDDASADERHRTGS